MIQYTGETVRGSYRVVAGRVMATMLREVCGLRPGETYAIRALRADGNAVVEPSHPTPRWGWACEVLGSCPNYLFAGPGDFVLSYSRECPMEHGHGL